MRFSPLRFQDLAGVPDATVTGLLHPERLPVFADAHPGPAWEPIAVDSLPLAWWMARLSHAAYHEDSATTESFSVRGWQLADTIEHGGVRMQVWQGRDATVAAFCGTRPRQVENLRHDGDARLVRWHAGGRVHRGFALAWMQVGRELASVLAGIDRQRLILTGHSLGAALALLAAHSLHPAAVIGFGAPRVGDAGFVAASTTIPIRRYQHACDGVGHLPPQVLGFRHAGQLAFFTSDGELLIAPHRRRIHRERFRAALRFSLALPHCRPGLVVVRDLADHAILNYTTRLSRLILGDLPPSSP